MRSDGWEGGDYDSGEGRVIGGEGMLGYGRETEKVRMCEIDGDM